MKNEFENVGKKGKSKLAKIKDVNEDEDEDVKEGGKAGSDDEEVGMQCDYDYFGDTRNRKGEAGEEGYTKQNKGFKEDKRIYYIKEKKKRQREEDLKKNQVEEEEEEDIDPLFYPYFPYFQFDSYLVGFLILFYFHYHLLF